MDQVCWGVKHLQLDWEKQGMVTPDRVSSDTLQSLLTKHEDIFRDELGIITSCKAKLQIQKDAQPKSCKVRTVPFDFKEPVEPRARAAGS